MPKNRNIQVEEILADLPMFEQLGGAHLACLARQAQIRRVPAGTVLFGRGHPAIGCYAVIHGLVKLSLCSPEGVEKVLRLVGAGETFAESVIFDPQRQPAGARTLADCVLVFLPAAAMIDLLEKDGAFARALVASLSRRVHMLIADIESLSLSTATQRVAAYLHALAPACRADLTGGPVRVRLPANKTVIASRIGVTKETFSRLLHELSARGLIEVQQNEILLFDTAQLVGLAREAARG